jgi:GST-like protein
MIRFYFHPTPNPAKVALFLEESGLPYTVVPVDTRKGEQHDPAFRAINPNGKVLRSSIPTGRTKPARVFDSTAILLYLAEKDRPLSRHPGRPAGPAVLADVHRHRPGPLFGQAVHFQYFAPEDQAYAINRYRREAERH